MIVLRPMRISRPARKPIPAAPRRSFAEVAQQSLETMDQGYFIGVGKMRHPLLVAWVLAPPNSSEVTSSWVTVFTTFGPVTNMYEVSSTIMIKSVKTGE